jgi:hypothetical protein
MPHHGLPTSPPLTSKTGGNAGQWDAGLSDTEKGKPALTNRGFDNIDPQKELSRASGASSGGNFADDPERTSMNTDALRDAIDHGKTRDKVSAIDSAAAPLGTDDEAGEIPPERSPEDLPNADRGKRPKLPL